MNIADEAQQLGVMLDENSFVSALKKVSLSVPPVVEPRSVTELNIMHDPRKWNNHHLDCEVHVV